MSAVEEHPGSDEAGVEAFLSRWEASGAAERANYVLFLSELCDLLGVPRPEPSRPDAPGDYVVERPVTIQNGDGTTSTGRIDLYRRDCFVLETKQGVTAADATANPLVSPRPARKGHGVRGSKGWDEAMFRARAQAENYAKNLPPGEQWPPVLVVVDVGYSIELYADFSRSGRPYLGFPAHGEHRVLLPDLRRPEVRDRLRAAWLDPTALDPTRRSARVTREVAAKLAELAKLLEADGHEPERAAHFLMRCLFTMFAEDVGLLPRDAFRDLLKRLRDDRKLDLFPHKLRALWEEMNRGGFSAVLDAHLKRFNGGLFAEPEALPLTGPQLDALIAAAGSEWSEVEPAIFGTLLERALDRRERHKLGAHYTPRAYVERLVLPTVVEPLREQWATVQAEALQHDRDGKRAEAIKVVEEFLRRLCATTVLDPACGTGNFLYVTMEHLKRLEGEVWDVLRGLGRRQEALGLVGETVGPGQFLGIELNPRAAAIADLVLWIGYLQWHLRTFGVATVPEPVLLRFDNIACRDAVLAYDRVEVVTDPDGRPVTRWDGRTTKKHPVTGEDVPDDSARVEVLRYVNPRKAEWPRADYVVGNPPFVGTRRMRLTFGDGYVCALSKSMPNVPENADYVMYWWDHAAEKLSKGELTRFGLITTNSITQSFNRVVLRNHLESNKPISIVFSINDHPWIDSSEGADVRIAMTVACQGIHDGIRIDVDSETDPICGEDRTRLKGLYLGKIGEDLRIGASPSSAVVLKSNSGIAFWGVKFYGDGFIVDAGSSAASGVESLSRPFVSGRDLTGVWRRLKVVDCDGLIESELREKFPDAYQYLLDRVKPVRDHNPRALKRERWWIFGENQPGMRRAVAGKSRYIATTETAKHRLFQFLNRDVLAEGTVAVISLDDAYFLGVLSSRPHIVWALAAGGRLGVGNDPRYNKTLCFDNYPFPERSSDGSNPIRGLAEALDAHRKRQQAQHPDLTLTGMYNVLAKLCSGEPLTAKEKDIHERGLVSVLKQLHDELDAAVFAAYGWPASLSDEEILERLVALNRERAEEERRGLVRWLRPEFQAPREAAASPKPVQGRLGIAEDEAEEPDAPAPASPGGAGAKRPWPSSLAEQAQALRSALAGRGGPASPEELARAFRRAPRARVAELLDTLATLGQARPLPDGRFAPP